MLAFWRTKEAVDTTVHLMEAGLVLWPFNISIAVSIFTLSLAYVKEHFVDEQMLVITIRFWAAWRLACERQDRAFCS